MRRGVAGLLGALVPLGLLLGGTSLVAPATAGTIVEDAPAAGTPHVLDGMVRAVTRVGNRIVLGGDFTQVREADDATVVERVNLVSFDPDTGDIDTAFVPDPNGTVDALEPGPAGSNSVYVGGDFSEIGGVPRSRLALVRLSDGSVSRTFDPAKANGKVKDLALRDGRLWIAGAFTHLGGRARPALATVNPKSGAFDSYMSLQVTGLHRGGFTGVGNIDIDAAGDRLVATGNFRRIDGKRREQLALLELRPAGAAVTAFRTRFFETPCRRVFRSYVDDARFSPDGTYFVAVTTGGHAGGPLGPCDATVRFETAARGSDVPYSWLAKTGGDSLYSVDVTESVVYVGGHPRWQNNTSGRNDAGPGAVSRPGVAALDPSNGLPLSWNPTKQRGVGVLDLFRDPLGLWIASDTEIIADQLRPRIALMPDQGRVVPEFEAPGDLPKLYLAGVPEPSGSALVSRAVNGAGFGADVAEPAGVVAWSEIRGAFLLDGQLYTAFTNGDLLRRTFDGSSYGEPVAVDGADEIVPLTAWRTDISQMTAMFFDRGRVYFTKTDSPRLFYRYFAPESDVVGADRRVASRGVPGIDFSKVGGMTLADGTLYLTTRAGVLKRVTWDTGARSGRPVPGTVRILSGPKKDGRSWKALELLAPDAS